MLLLHRSVIRPGPPWHTVPAQPDNVHFPASYMPDTVGQRPRHTQQSAGMRSCKDVNACE
jgi:hypothetical protein